MTYLTPDIIDDETAVAEGILAAIADRIEGWEPSEGHVETPLAEAVGVAIATAVTVLKDTVLDAYMGFGQRILALPRGAAGVATATSTWTLTPETVDGLLIEAGTEVQATLSDGSTTTLIVAEDVTILPGIFTAIGVPLVALDAGPEPNGATNPAVSSDLVGVQDVTIDVAASGGADPEDPDEYVSRAADRARRLHAIPITPADHAAFALDVPAVARAAVVNLLNPAAPGVESPGHLTIFPVDAAGAALTSDAKDELEEYFQSLERPLNVTVHIADPQDVDVAIEATVRAATGEEPDELEATSVAAIASRMSRAVWDADPATPGGWRPIPSSELTIYDVAAALDDLPGIRAVTDAAVNGTDRVALPGPVSIPNVTSITVTVLP